MKKAWQSVKRHVREVDDAYVAAYGGPGLVKQVRKAGVKKVVREIEKWDRERKGKGKGR